uniref:Uncharacterized protein n=1 Tax=Plectus sambesii TaxID=2011161 RepID=A0A914V834_9BILA
MDRLQSGVFEELELALLADTLQVRVEVFDTRSMTPHVAAVYPDKSSRSAPITFLKTADQRLLPLYHVAEFE